MNRLIARLIDCGMTRTVALYMFNLYRRRGKLNEFEQYVESVEKSCEQMETV